MRKLIYQVMISIDGYFEGPGKDISWHRVDDEFNDYAVTLLKSVDMLLFGRVTYELMASYWPTPEAIKNDPAVAGWMNKLPKTVFSNSLKTSGWNNTQVSDNVMEELTRLKSEPGKDLLIIGSSDLAVSIISHNLIDEFHIITAPVIIGSGKPLFKGIDKLKELSLLKTKSLASGNVIHYYQSQNQ
jgi:dihydrofolate reductase